MAGLHGINPIMVQMMGQTGQALDLRPGQAYPGAVQGVGGNMSVQVGNQNVPIEPVAGLQAGQQVEVELVEGGQHGPHLRVTPHAPPPSASPAPGQGGIWGVLTAALESLNALDAAENARQLPPAFLPPRQPALEQLILLFLNRGTMGRDLQRLSTLIRQAQSAGVIDSAHAEGITELIASITVADPLRMRTAFQRIARTAGRSMEARLASAIDSGRIDRLLTALREDIQGELLRLRNDETVARYFRSEGQINEFHQALDRLLNRLTAMQTQNLRAFELPYLFLELPFVAESPLHFVQLHFFGEGQGQTSRFDAKNSTVVIDLETVNLGALWITMTIINGHCSCWLRVTEMSFVEQLEDAAGELVEQLAQAGYAGAEVQVTLWDGDRLKEAAGLMRRFSRINLRA